MIIKFLLTVSETERAELIALERNSLRGTFAYVENVSMLGIFITILYYSFSSDAKY